MVKVLFDETKKEWVTLEKNEEKGLYLDGYLKAKLDNIKYMQRNQWDCMFSIVGREGSGKSTLSFVIGQYLSDMGLQLGNIAGGSDDALAKLQSLPDESILIIDEAELMFSSRDTMKKEQRQLIKIMMIIRQKRMVLILVCPSFFDLSKYIAVDRSRFVIRCYTTKKMQRGFFAYWGEKRKRVLYELGKKSYGSYSKPKADFYGRFTDYKLPFDAEYQKTKLASLMEAFKPTGSAKKDLSYRQDCDKCDYAWNSRVKEPVSCPNCHIRLKKNTFSLEEPEILTT